MEKQNSGYDFTLFVIQNLFHLPDNRQWRQFWNGALQQRWDATSSATTGAKAVLGEDKIAALLRTHFPTATFIQVTDVSGGCGAMFEVLVEADNFKGLPIVKQHRLVTQALSKEIKEMHGIRIQTSVPAKS